MERVVPGFLGAAHAPFKPDGAGKADMVLNGITLDRLADRRSLLASLDSFRRDVDASGQMAGLDAYTQQALEASVFGAPSYVLDGEIFWGQDRLDFLERALTGR